MNEEKTNVGWDIGNKGNRTHNHITMKRDVSLGEYIINTEEQFGETRRTVEARDLIAKSERLMSISAAAGEELRLKSIEISRLQKQHSSMKAERNNYKKIVKFLSKDL